MSAVERMPADAPGAPDTRERPTADGLVLQIAQDGVSDVEVAAVSVAVHALLSAGGPPTAPAGAPAWRRAGLQEASSPRRLRTPAELTQAEAR